MTSHLVYAALGLAGAFAVPAAQAQTMIATQPAPAVIAQPPLGTAPAETVRTTRTVRTVHTLVPVRQRIVTTRTVTRQVMPPEPAVVAPIVAAAPAPQRLYDAAPAVAPVADIYAAPAYDNGYAYRAPAYDYAPLYDVTPAPIAPAPVVTTPAVAPVVSAPVVSAPVMATQPVIYRYIYEPDRILVIDPTTNIAVQAIPR